MAFKAAVASLDGRTVNEHFGRSEQFFIYERTPEGFFYRETRAVIPGCKDGRHSGSTLQETADRLRDCSAVVAAKVGAGAAALLESRGTAVYEAPFLIEDVLEQLDLELEAAR